MEPAVVVDVLDEAGKVFSDVVEGLESHRLANASRTLLALASIRWRGWHGRRPQPPGVAAPPMWRSTASESPLLNATGLP